ncbi:MAG: DUF504 domain-containing protein [Desulfobulbaceae bacterium]|nr:DUF504 domain-containing protein [Desulfobulbaceae bacterium]
MIPIHDLLSRIRWDQEFSRADFAIGYYDRLLDRIVLVPFSELIFPADDRNSIQVMAEDGVVHSVPLHRIKEVYRNHELIWLRRH